MAAKKQRKTCLNLTKRNVYQYVAHDTKYWIKSQHIKRIWLTVFTFSRQSHYRISQTINDLEITKTLEFHE
jgi:hypothetical protein